MAATETIQVENTEELSESSKAIIKDCNQLLEQIDNIEGVEESLSGWESAQKEQAFTTLDTMIAKLRTLVEIATSYGNVGMQAAAATEAAEANVQELSSKLSEYVG